MKHKILIVIISIIIGVLITAGGVWYYQNQKEKPEELITKIEEYDSYSIFSLSRWGIVFRFGPGWIISTITERPTDVLTKEFKNKIIGQAGIPWFLYSEVLESDFIPLAHYMLVTPERYSEISQIPSDELNQFGYWDMAISLNELLREIDVVILNKKTNQTLNQFIDDFDGLDIIQTEEFYQKERMAREKQYQEGTITKEHLERILAAHDEYLKEIRRGFFGNFKNKEAITLTNGVESLLLWGPTKPMPSDGTLFLLFSCPTGRSVIILGQGPFSSHSINYLDKFREIRENISFTKTFCE